MRKLTILLLLAVLLASCDKDKMVTVNGIVQGYVKDLNTGALLSDVSIEYAVGSNIRTDSTNSDGYYDISGLPIGYTLLVFKKAGYAVCNNYAYIDYLDEPPVQKDGGSVNYSTVLNAYLPALDAGLTGVIKKAIGPGGEIRPAAGFEVTITFEADLVPKSYSTTTSDIGAFSFTDLPGGIYSYVTISPTSDEDNYYSDQDNMTLSPGSITEYYITLNRHNKGIYLVSTSLDEANGTYSSSYPVDEPIVLTFSQPVDKDLTDLNGYITLWFVALNWDTDIEFDGNTVTITPPADLTNDVLYTLEFLISSETPDDEVYQFIQFRTEP
jgi:hypothetical protein